MFISYIKDMKSWILFFIGAIGFTDVILWLDQGIDVEFRQRSLFQSFTIIFFMYL